MVLVNRNDTSPRVQPALAIIALAVGGFAIGTTEFVTMGVLPQIARGLSVTEPVAAHGITAYALGVIVGVPLLSILGARFPRKGFLIVLIGAYALFNLLTAVAPTGEVFVAARFLDGLPHGAVFGIATLVAADLVAAERRGRAVASVLLGLTVANIVGVPAAAWLGQVAGWRASYTACAVLAGLAALLIAPFVARRPAPAQAGGKGEARVFFTNPQVWLTLLAGAVGLGGTFAIYSYIATTVTEVAGLGAGLVPLFLLAFGVGLTVGVWAGGELASWSVYRTLLLSIVATAAAMLLFWAIAPHGWWALLGVFLVSAAGAVTVTSLQLRLMDVAGEAATLGAAMTQAALNLGNALGATAGGLVISAGFGYRSPALVAAGLALIGILVISLSGVLGRQKATDAAGAAPRARRRGRLTSTPSQAFPKRKSIMTVPPITLNDGVEIPQIGFGTMNLSDARDGSDASHETTAQGVASAIAADYRHFDTAQMYANEKGLSLAIARSGLPRDDLFLTSKLGNGNHRPDDVRRSFEKTPRRSRRGPTRPVPHARRPHHRRDRPGPTIGRRPRSSCAGTPSRVDW